MMLYKHCPSLTCFFWEKSETASYQPTS